MTDASPYTDEFFDEVEAKLATEQAPAAITAEAGTRAVIYLRVSSTGQVNTDYDPEGNSIPAQRVACLRKAEQIGLTLVDEYVEPGKSATEMTKRVAFQQMLTRVRQAKDVDYVIIYKVSRLARNRYDDAIVMADLRKRGVTLVSATESVDDSPVGQLMHGILATVNEYQSREPGADISYKMDRKAKNGGTLGRAPLGYLNVFDRSEFREIRTVAPSTPTSSAATSRTAAAQRPTSTSSGSRTPSRTTTPPSGSARSSSTTSDSTSPQPWPTRSPPLGSSSSS